MKKLSFIIVILGIFILLLIMALSSPALVFAPSDMSKLGVNSKVQTTGKVISERMLYENTKLLKLNNSIEIICNSCPSYINRTIYVTGIVDKYQNKTQILALKITQMSN